MFRCSGREQAVILNWEVTGKVPAFHFCIFWVNSCSKGHGEHGIRCVLADAAGRDLTNKHHPNASSGGESWMPVREVSMCVLETLWLVWKYGLLSPSSFLKSPSVPGDLPETFVTDALEVTV